MDEYGTDGIILGVVRNIFCSSLTLSLWPQLSSVLASSGLFPFTYTTLDTGSKGDPLPMLRILSALETEVAGGYCTSYPE